MITGPDRVNFLQRIFLCFTKFFKVFYRITRNLIEGVDVNWRQRQYVDRDSIFLGVLLDTNEVKKIRKKLLEYLREGRGSNINR